MLYERLKDTYTYKQYKRVPLGLLLPLYYWTNGFGPASYQEKLFRYSFGFLPTTLPNPKGRRDTLRIHDLNHIASGVPNTNWFEEARQNAWELGSGCPGVAKFFNLATVFFALFLWPIRSGKIFRSFVRGRRSQNFYGKSNEELTVYMGRPLKDALSELHIPSPSEVINPTWTDRLLFLGFVLLSIVSMPLFTLLSVAGIFFSLGYALTHRGKLWQPKGSPELRTFPTEILSVLEKMKEGKPVEYFDFINLLTKLQNPKLLEELHGLDPILFPGKK